MKQLRHVILLAVSVGLLSACTSTTRAPVVERTPLPAPRLAAPPEEKKDERGMHTVRRGDTLIRIALDNGLNYRELAAWNNLVDPDDIKLGQVLRLTAPDGGVVTSPVSMPTPEVRPAPVPKKTGPRGDKRQYTEAAMADLQKGDGNGPARGERAEGADTPAAPVHAAAVARPALATGATVSAIDNERLSWMWPSDGRIVATFDEGKNKGIDIAGRPGQSVVAAGSGKVMYAGSGIRGYGNLVIVKHSNNLLSAYAHNRAILVKEGATVSKGQVIAEMGDSDADSVKLHFEIRQQGKPVDPTRFLPSR